MTLRTLCILAGILGTAAVGGVGGGLTILMVARWLERRASRRRQSDLDCMARARKAEWAFLSSRSKAKRRG
jgi:hypothetical protein